MKIRYTPLVKIKKDTMERSEHDLQQAGHSADDAKMALEQAHIELDGTSIPKAGTMSELLQARMMLAAQRVVIGQKRQNLDAAVLQTEMAREALKSSMLEHEKFKYLETEQLETALKERKRKLQRELDEIALQGHHNKKQKK